MPEGKKGRGRPKKVQSVETNATQSPVLDSQNYEFNSYFNTLPVHRLDEYFCCSISDHFNAADIKSILADPIEHHELARKLAMFVYNSEGVVTNAIDYMTALPCLDRVVCGKKKKFSFGSQKLEKNKELMMSTLETINDRQFIRDALRTDMNEGTCFYYFETTTKPVDKRKFMDDYDVENIIELCDVGVNADIIPLPYQYTKIVGRKNGRNVIAFNLRYFDEFTVSHDKERKLKKYPVEISNAYRQWVKGGKHETGNWVVLDNDKTIAHKIKCKISEPWGRPLAIAAIGDILYQDEFIDTKRNVLREINSQVIVQTFPQGKDAGSSALTKQQQQHQHDAVKSAVLTKNNRGGTTFVSVAAGTKLDSLDINNTDIFDEKNESNLTDKIALDLGIAASLLNGSGSGNYSSQQNNLELINAQIYTWIQELQFELNHVINANIIKDKKNKVEVYYLPTSLVNRKSFFDMMKDLYSLGGSLSFVIAASGVNPEMYFNVLDEEVDNAIYERYKPHPTSYTMSGSDDDEGGRPSNDDPTNASTLITKANNGNAQPKPSTK